MNANGKRRIVVTGTGVIAPNGVGIEAFRAALKTGKSGISHQEELKKLNFASQIGGGSGSWTRIPWTAGSALSRAIS